jgi:hypothetical protein
MSVFRGGPNGGRFYSNITQPVKVDMNFIVDHANGNGLGIRSLKSNGWVRNVFMNTSATPGKNDNYTNPNPAAGYALIQLKQNFNSYLGGFSGFVSPQSTYSSGSYLAISGSSMTAGLPYIITSVGSVPAASFTIAPVADVSGSLAGKYITLTDISGNNYVIWFSVSGVGTAPALTGALNGYIAVQQSFATNATAGTIGGDLATTIGQLNGSASFTATGTTTVTVTNALAANSPFGRNPNAGTSGFTVSAPTFTALAKDWQSVGLPPGLTPTVNQSFIATTTGGALGSGKVVAPGVSGVLSVEVIGDPNQSIANASIATNGGAWVLVQFLAPTISTGAYVSPLIPTKPADFSVVGMSMFFDMSSASVDGL